MPDLQSSVAVILSKHDAEIIRQVLHRYIRFAHAVVENTDNMTGQQLIAIHLATQQYDAALMAGLALNDYLEHSDGDVKTGLVNILLGNSFNEPTP